MAADDLLPQPQQQQQQQQQQEQQQQQALLAKKPPGTWTPLETSHLIDAYQDKWYSLKRGQLRTRHWEEVADSLAARCAGLDSTKSSVQCRHKIEKLRRRYRSERQLLLRKGPGSSRWPYYDRLDLMERGPGNVADVRIAGVPGGLDGAKALYSDLEFQKRMGARDLQDHESTMSLDDDVEDSDQPRNLSDRGVCQDGPPEDNDASYSSLNKKHVLNMDYDATGAFKTDEYRIPRISAKSSFRHRKAVESAPLAELVSVVRSLGEGFLRMEQMKLQMQRDNERLRADMELRRTEMVLNSQKQIAELFTRALVSSKKGKKPQTSTV